MEVNPPVDISNCAPKTEALSHNFDPRARETIMLGVKEYKANHHAFTDSKLYSRICELAEIKSIP